MNVLAEREAWTKAYQEGGSCDSLWLADYRENHKSGHWRCSRSVEELCAYILVLEGAVEDRDNTIQDLLDDLYWAGLENN